jgi:hypothetical protein
MKRALNPREKRLLIGCLLTIFLVINFLAYGQFSSRRTALTSSIARLKDQSANNDVWLSEQDLWQKRGKWLQTNMPSTDSVGRSQGQLLDELQNSALDSGLKVSNQTPLQSTTVTMPNSSSDIVATEVAVSLRVRGDQDKVLRWLLSIQSPERFLAMKTFEIELDTKAKEKIPQAQCNLTLARWFNPNAVPAPAPPAPDAAAPPAPVPTSAPAPASVPADDNPENTNPAPAPAPAPAPSAPAAPRAPSQSA